MLFSNRSFFAYTFLKISLVLLSVLSFSLASAQEDPDVNLEEPVVAVTSDLLPVPDTAEIIPKNPAVIISNVRSIKHDDGSAELIWQTNLLSAGAVTVLYREGVGYPDQLVQQRLTSGELSTEHRYVLRGLEPGSYSVVVEVVGVDMQYDRFTGRVTIPEVMPESSPLGFLLAWFVSLSFLIVLVVLYEIIKHRSEFSRAIKELKKTQLKPAAKKSLQSKSTNKKVTAKAVKKKAIKTTSKK